MSERSAADSLYRRHSVELVRFATALVGPTDAADLVSEAMMSLLKNGQLVTAVNPRALMHRTVTARARSWQRSAVRRRARERLTTAQVQSQDPSLRPEVITAVMRLSPRQRACVYLTYWEDLTAGDVADRLMISEGTVTRYLARARNRLRRVIDA